MREEIASPNTSLVRGYAWHAYPDPATTGTFAGDHPFGTDEPPGPDRTSPRAPDGVVSYWLLGRNTPGISNRVDGHTYLVLTESPEPPAPTEGWFLESARLDEDFEVDQRGGRSVRLIRAVGTAE